MFNENDLERVYVVGQEVDDQNVEETEESDTEHDQRRLGLEYYDAVSDAVDLRQVMDPISTQSSSTPQENVLTLTPDLSMFPDLRKFRQWERFRITIRIQDNNNNWAAWELRSKPEFRNRLMLSWQHQRHF